MRLEYLFTESRDKKAWGSTLIKWGTGKLCPDLKPCSHVAIKIDNIILESTMTRGVSIVPYLYWIKNQRVVHAFRCPENRDAGNVLELAVKSTYGKKYDYAGILFFTWRMLGFLLLKRPLPKINRLHHSSRYFCIELISFITNEDYSMTSPIQLVERWKDQKLEEINPWTYNKEVESKPY